MLKKTTFREIKSSLGRYLAILAIVALGVGFFSGLKVTREAMLKTAGDYLTENRLFDYQLISTLGYEDNDVNTLSKEKGIAAAEGSVSVDALFTAGHDAADRVIKLHSLPEKINTLTLEQGRLPRNSSECVVDYRLFEDNPIGKKLQISDANEKDTLDMLKYREYTIVGTVVSPIYLNFERGGTSLGNGSVAGFAYMPKESFDTDYYTEIYLKLNRDLPLYSDQYQSLLDETQPRITHAAEKAATARYDRLVGDAEKKLAEGQAEYEENYQNYLSEKAAAQTELAQRYADLMAGEDEITRQKATLSENRTALEKSKAELNKKKEAAEAGMVQLAQKREEFEAAKPYLPPQQAQLIEAQLTAEEEKLTAGLAQIAGGLAQVDEGFAQIKAGESALQEAEAELAGGRAAYERGKTEAEDGFAKAEAEFANAQAELAEGEAEIGDIEKPTTYVLDRNTNVGYACFESDSNIIDGIARVFPIFFFLVAALVCMTTMTRMIDEQRTQIGVFKALGYGNGAVIAKYLSYAGSASFIGWAVGFFSGCYIFPNVIWNAYGMMYDFSAKLYYIVDGPLALISLLVSLSCSMGATLISCYGDFKEVPAELIRPKAPKEGKRILLERIPFIWRRLSFLYKVSFRNIFRYKKRFFMMVLGISGCTALLVTGLGVRDSIKNVVDYQYDEIEVYDYSITFKDHMDGEKQAVFAEKAKSAGVEDMIFLYQGSADLVSGGRTKSINLTASTGEGFSDYIHLADSDGNPLQYPKDGQTVVCRKLAEDFSLSVGDKITLRTGEMDEMKEIEVTVSGICENYVHNYVYISQKTCEDGWGKAPEIKSALVHAEKDGADDTDAIYASSAKALKMDAVTTVSVNWDLRQRVSNMMQSLDYVIALVILSAGALAFIVLYNLTNINITERIREIATIKVLGFYPKETAAYVFRENLFLTAISALVGLVLGKWLHAFVMSQIRVDMLHFDVRIAPVSYVLAVVLTFVFAAVVNLAMSRKLEKISMTESLKSIE